jgi:surface protein
MGFHPGRRAYPVSTNTSNSISNKKGWMVGTNQTYGIGRAHNVNNVVSQKTTPYNYQDGELKDDRNLVVQQNTLSGVGKMRSQFMSSSAGIKSVRYYIGDENSVKCIQGYLFSTKQELQSAVDDWCNVFTKAQALETYGDINTWDVSEITDMSQLFENKSDFNSDISCWNVSNVTNMFWMFGGANNFNQDIGSWDVSKVTNTSYMFYKATNFNKDIGNWNVSEVTNISGMFKDATNFNKDIGNWNVSKVTDMDSMFNNATKFNQDIGSWTVSNVTNMKDMFSGASKFNQDIGGWDVSEVDNMVAMFRDAINFNQNLSGWQFNQYISTAYGGVIPLIFSGATAILTQYSGGTELPVSPEVNLWASYFVIP